VSSCFEIHTADALAKGRQVSLIIVETTGAVLHAEHAISMLLSWQDEGRAKGATDRTIYGSARTATTSYFAHHLRLISLAAVVGAPALPVALWAKGKAQKSRLACAITVADFIALGA
jgi:hypothetical protein